MLTIILLTILGCEVPDSDTGSAESPKDDSTNTGGDSTPSEGGEQGSTEGVDEEITASHALAVEGGPSARSSAITVKLDESRILLFGGQKEINATLSDGYIYDLTKKQWKAISSVNAPIYGPRADNVRVAVSNGAVYFWVEKKATDGSLLIESKLYRYNYEKDLWQEIAHPVPVGTYPKFIVFDGEFLFTDVQQRFRVSTGQWEAMPPNPWSRFNERNSVSLCAGAIVFWGGYNHGKIGEHEKGVQNAGWIYKKDTNKWTKISGNNAPSARMDHTSVCIDNKVVIWGGKSAADTTITSPPGILNDGAIYDPSADTWNPIAPDPSVPPQLFHSSHSFKSEMIIVKGVCDRFNNCEEIALFDLSKKTWRSMKSKDQSMIKSLQYSGQSVAEVGGYLFFFGGHQNWDDYSQEAYLFPLTP
jgi:N-acetylneuraminic acid mutarotase